MDIPALRSLFPITEEAVFLNSAAESPLSQPFRQKLDEYLDAVTNTPQQKPSVRTGVRRRLAGLLGGQPNEYALVTSTGVGLSIVARGYNWQKGDNVVVPLREHWNNTFPWQALAQQGLEVRFVPVGPDYRVSPEALAALVDKNTKMVSVSAVSFNSGYRSDLKQLAAIAHDRGALLAVDGIQAAGVMPLNIEEDDIDILAAGGFKWLLGMPGTGFLYVKQSAQEHISPLLPGMFAADNFSPELKYHPDARRYETGSIAYSLFYAWKAGLDLLQEVGIENISRRVFHLTDKIISGLREVGAEILSPVEHLSERSGILIFSVGSPDDNKALYEALLKENIIITLRAGALRVSPNFFNTEEEIDLFLDAVARMQKAL